MIKIRSPGKVNLFLEVLGRRSDGYHEVQTILQTIGLYDEISLREQARGIRISSQAMDLPKDKENLVHQAAQLLQQEGGVDRGVEIAIDKNIPIASGLGGGSSDAAATLVGLNRLWNLGIAEGDLYRLACRLGTDVPFFLKGGTALATGRGDELTHVSPPGLWLILLVPGFKISTAQAYKSLGLTKGPRGIKMMMIALRSGNASSIGKALYNRLEEAILPRYPVIGQIKDRLDRVGVAGCLMSGSGPAAFGLVQTREKAFEIYSEACRFSPRMGRVYLAQTIDQGVELAGGKGGED